MMTECNNVKCDKALHIPCSHSVPVSCRYFQHWQPEYKRGIELFPHLLVFSTYSDIFSQSYIFHTDNQSISKTFLHISYVSFYFMHSLFVQMSKNGLCCSDMIHKYGLRHKYGYGAYRWRYKYLFGGHGWWMKIWISIWWIWMVEEDINMWTWMVNEDMNIYMVDMDGEWRYKYLYGVHGWWMKIFEYL